MWLVIAWRPRTLPLGVILKRFFAPEWVFILGMRTTYSSRAADLRPLGGLLRRLGGGLVRRLGGLLRLLLDGLLLGGLLPLGRRGRALGCGAVAAGGPSPAPGGPAFRLPPPPLPGPFG